MLIRTTCNKCKDEVDVAFYFYDIRIVTKCFSRINEEFEYTASALGRSMCPHCGAEIHKQFASILFGDDLIELATRKEIRRE